MKNLLLVLSTFLFPLVLASQVPVSTAYLGPDGEVLTETVMMDRFPTSPVESSTYSQLTNWPKKIAASPNFKNFRGVTLADLDGDGADEILVGSRNTLHVFKGDGTVLWTKALTGTAIYPPSVADIYGNGTLFIVQVTGGVPNNGRVYLLDVAGNDLPGWPLNFSSHWIICAPVIADVSGDGVCEIIVQSRTSNNLHVLKPDGTPLNSNWPVNLGGTPAITPSVADIDNDGLIEIITGNSDGTLFAFNPNGQPKPGFPVPSDTYKFSYQSPLLVDLDGEGQLSIVGSTHGDAPKFYVRNSNGSYRSGWPVAVPDNSWTYSPPTVVDMNGDGNYEIFMSRPINENPLPMLFGFNPDGTLLDHFPFIKAGGLEGFTSIADITGDGSHDILFGSNMMVESKGFIHAWRMDGNGEINGFPLRPFGFTFMNGPNLGDVNGDGILDLVALSYEQTFSVNDSTIINVYDLQVPVSQANVLFGTYKGSNDRSGHVMQRNPIISVDPESFSVTGLLGYTFTEDLLIINTGNATLNFNIEIEYLNGEWDWLIPNVNAGSVAPTSNQVLELLFDLRYYMDWATYYANIIIQSNDPVNPVLVVPVSLDVAINSIENFGDMGITIYPNPVNSDVIIRCEEALINLQLHTVDGLLVCELARSHTNSITLGLAGYEPGIYILTVTSASGKLRKVKIVKI